MRFFFIASAVLALSACASTQPVVAEAKPAADAGTVVAANDKVVCHRVQAMGELTTHTICQKQSDINLQSQEALQDAARANQAAHMHAVPGAGG